MEEERTVRRGGKKRLMDQNTRHGPEERQERLRNRFLISIYLDTVEASKQVVEDDHVAVDRQDGQQAGDCDQQEDTACRPQTTTGDKEHTHTHTQTRTLTMTCIYVCLQKIIPRQQYRHPHQPLVSSYSKL